MFNQADGVYTYIFEAEKKPDCIACNQHAPKHLEFASTDTLGKLIAHLIDNSEYQMKSPAITTHINGKTKTLYMTSIKSLEELTKPNLDRTLADLGLVNGQELLVTDSTTPSTMTFYLKLKFKVFPIFSPTNLNVCVCVNKFD